MKKFLAGLLTVIMALTFAGCDKIGIGTNQKNEADTEVRYNDSQVLFYAQDRCDVEDDRTMLYSYNYKGELLNSNNSSGYIGYYSENGLAPAVDPNTGNVGFVDKDGVFQIEPKYEDAAPFSKDGIALVKVEIEENGNYIDKCGYINSKGEEIIPCIYDEATSFFDCGYALALVKKDVKDENGYTFSETWKHYIIDKNGNVVIEIDVEAENRRIDIVYEDYFVCSTDNTMAIFDYSNNKIFEEEVKEFDENDTQFVRYFAGKDSIYKSTYKIDEFNYEVVKSERFNGKKFVEDKKDYEITSKQVATTQSGWGFGVIENEKTVIPFEYDAIYEYGDYFVAIKYTGDNIYFDQTFDIYDKNYNKTAENIGYAFSDRSDAYGVACQLPNGYFQIMVENEDYDSVFGIIDYTGQVIVEPVFGRGITLCTYEGTGVFNWEYIA